LSLTLFLVVIVISITYPQRRNLQVERCDVVKVVLVRIVTFLLRWLYDTDT